jgi:hypothetical protein
MGETTRRRVELSTIAQAERSDPARWAARAQGPDRAREQDPESHQARDRVPSAVWVWAGCSSFLRMTPGSRKRKTNSVV